MLSVTADSLAAILDQVRREEKHLRIQCDQTGDGDVLM